MARKETLHERIRQHFQQKILGGEIRPGEQIPPEMKIAEEFHVSRITVSRAIKELENAGLVYRIQGKGTFVSADPERVAGAEAARDARLVAVVLPYSDAMCYDILSGVETELARHKLFPTFHCSDHSPEKERDIILHLMDTVCGFIVYPNLSYGNADVFSSVLIRRKPLVLLDQTVEELNASAVICDNEQAYFKLIHHLIDNGHRRIAFVSSPLEDARTARERYRGYCHALLSADIPVDYAYLNLHFLERHGIPGASTEVLAALHCEAAKKTLDKFLSLPSPPTAIACVNDMTAIYLEQVAIAAGLRVPEDLSIVGFDNIASSAHVQVPLTTVEQPFKELGSTGARLLVNQLKGIGKPNTVVCLNTRMVERQSVHRLTDDQR